MVTACVSPSPGSGSRSTWRARSADALRRPIQTTTPRISADRVVLATTSPMLGSFEVGIRERHAEGGSIEAGVQKEGRPERTGDGSYDGKQSRERQDGRPKARVPVTQREQDAGSPAGGGRRVVRPEAGIEGSAKEQLFREHADACGESEQGDAVGKRSRFEPVFVSSALGRVHGGEVLHEARERERGNARHDPEREGSQDEPDGRVSQSERLGPATARAPSGEERASSEIDGRLNGGGSPTGSLSRCFERLAAVKSAMPSARNTPNVQRMTWMTPIFMLGVPRRCGRTPRLTTVSLGRTRRASRDDRSCSAGRGSRGGSRPRR